MNLFEMLFSQGLSLVFIGVLSLGVVPGVAWFWFWPVYFRRSGRIRALLFCLLLSAVSIPLILMCWAWAQSAADVAAVFPAFIGLQILWCVLACWVSYWRMNTHSSTATASGPGVLYRTAENHHDQADLRYLRRLLQLRSWSDELLHGPKPVNCRQRLHQIPGCRRSRAMRKSAVAYRSHYRPRSHRSQTFTLNHPSALASSVVCLIA